MKPDFSGEYALNLDASQLSANVASSIQTASLRIKHDDPKFWCEGKFSFLNGETMQWAFELVAQAPGVTRSEREPGPATLEWDGTSLVFLSQDSAMTVKFRYELDGEGHLRMAEELRGTDHDQDNLWIFDHR